MEDVLTDARRIVDATGLPLLVDIDTGWGGAFNIGAYDPVVHQCRRRRRAHGGPGRAEALRPPTRQEVVPLDENGRSRQGRRWMRAPIRSFVIMARTDAAAVEGIDSAIDRACAYVEAGADMIFPEAMKTLNDYRRFKQAVKVPILANLTEFGTTPFFTTDEDCAK